jgi:glycosyltransferase involved in cell wall biosynthesis
MEAPMVTFMVPCYKLAHFLGECIDSILSQTFQDFEILIMDDCSPDNTPEVARAYSDPRVIHVRNNPNLGHLRNYNKGIAMSRGKYVWLISADDFLAKPYILDKYIRLLEAHPGIGYVFCPGVATKAAAPNVDFTPWIKEAERAHGDQDRIFKGHEILKRLLAGNTIVAPSGLVRKSCYAELGMFPLNMPWAGDWYLWCLFALKYDVGYFAEPMVCYREHDLNMTHKLWNEDVLACCEEDFIIPLTIKSKAEAFGFKDISLECLIAIARIYARHLTSIRYGMSSPPLTDNDFEESLNKRFSEAKEKLFVRQHVYSHLGSQYYQKGNKKLAKKYLFQSLKMNPFSVDLQVKHLLLHLGGFGKFLWKRLKARGSIMT